MRLWPSLGSVLMTFTINMRQIFLGKACKMPAQIPELCSWCLSSFAEQSGLPRGVAVPDVLLKEAPKPRWFSLSSPSAGAEAGAVFPSLAVAQRSCQDLRNNSDIPLRVFKHLRWVFLVPWEWQTEREFPVLPKALSIPGTAHRGPRAHLNKS